MCLANLYETGIVSFGQNPQVGTVITINFKKIFKETPVIMISPTHYHLTVNYYANITIFNMTNSSFQAKLVNSYGGNFTPAFDYLAIVPH